MAASPLVPTIVCALAFSTSGASVTPIQKVLSMMEDMRAKCIKGKKEEEDRFGAFQQFCTDTSAQKKKALEAEAAKIEKLDADIYKAASDVEVLSKDLTELDHDLGRWDTDKKAATDVRKKERADYQATHKDYVDTLDTVTRVLGLIKKMPEYAAQKSFIQKQIEPLAQAPMVPEMARHAIVSFIATAPEAYSYESRSGGVISMLSELHDRFRQEKTDLEKEEMNAKAAYQSFMQKLTDQIEMAQQQVSQKTKLRSQRKADKAQEDGDSKDTKTLHAEDTKYLSDLTTLCSKKSSDFESRQQLRAEEIEALSKAIDIIGSQTVKGSAEKHLPSAAFTQQGVGVSLSLAQLRSSVAPNLFCQRAASLLAERARLLNSPTLALAAQKASADPFTKVRRMIKDLIVKLMEEAAGEADHKAFCDEGLATNQKTRTYKAEAVEELTAEVEKQTAVSATLSLDIAELSEEISQIDATMNKASSERSEEKAKNLVTIKDAEEAQAAVAQALAVLREFYAKAGEATALVQQSPAEDAPETFDSAYTGMGSASTGVVGMLEVIESDFARLQTTTEAAEEEAVADFTTLMADSKEDKELKQAEIGHKSNKRTTTEDVLVSTKRSLHQTQTELDAALQYYDKLKSDCVDAGNEERVKKRKQEVASLQDAYKIFSGEDVPSLSDMKAESIEA